ncbi:MAG: pyridoxamine 5'-phosphate oxidase family protein [Planctomycetes bacterium]|nr:pyridoxamine 5'-phosphate oxidase family protein [Planctomycetota bacterium]MCW8134118.1 pyridoxamine 5'-phosphate oxidase family protein [Planctomycetota bacterium]
MIDGELKRFLEGGYVCTVATRDANLRPDWGHGVGVRVLGSRAVVYLCTHTSGRSIANIRDNGQLALVICEPMTHRTIQLKGSAVATRALDSADQAFAATLAQMARESIVVVGIAPHLAARWNFDDLLAIEFEVTGVFEATPGPKAGKAVA